MNDTAKRLSVVSNEIPDPPYPPETKANGWNPTMEIDRIAASDTWVLADDDERAWLLRIWFEAWRSVPVGSMPSDRRLFARRIGCKLAFLEAHAEIFMRGWVLHSDGNLYHTFITSSVGEMLKTRSKNREKVNKWRQEQAEKAKSNQLQDASNRLQTSNQLVGTDHGQDRTGQELNTGTNVPSSESPEGDSDRRVVGGNSPCPHSEIIALYHETLPELSAIAVSRWPESKDAKALQARWREDHRHQSLDFWERFFGTVRTNPHWMGQGPSGWSANLRWLVKRDNFAKVVDRMVDNARREGVRRG